MRIQSIRSFGLEMRFISGVAPHMLRAVTHGGTVRLTEVTLDNGAVGWGDGGKDDRTWEGRSAMQALRSCADTGVQMACYDAVGKALGEPAHVLMGSQVRSRVPFAYWTIDLPPQNLADQVCHAATLGYRVYKFKCRPWWDPVEQMEAAQAVAPEGFKLWLDFNGHLKEARLALPILKRLQEFTCVGGFESPIPQRDIEGYQTLRSRLDLPIAAHYAAGACHVVSEPGWDSGFSGPGQLAAGSADGYVLGGSDVDRVRATAAVLNEHRRPFWIQTVGTALRAAWVSHLASTCAMAQLSSLAAHDLWERDVAKGPTVRSGYADVPTTPGLGVDVDVEAVAELAAQPAVPAVRRVSTVIYPDGGRWSFSGEQQRHEAFYFGRCPGFTPGIRLRVWEDDGSAEFEALFVSCSAEPMYHEED